MSIKPGHRRPSLPADGEAYRSAARDAELVTCRFAAKQGGELCLDASKCTESAQLRAYCEKVAGGTTHDGVVHDDSALAAGLSAAKHGAHEAASTGLRISTEDLLELRIQADEAESAAATAARAMGWVA